MTVHFSELNDLLLSVFLLRGVGQWSHVHLFGGNEWVTGPARHHLVVLANGQSSCVGSHAPHGSDRRFLRDECPARLGASFGFLHASMELVDFGGHETNTPSSPFLLAWPS